jgi:hypothetical protein
VTLGGVITESEVEDGSDSLEGDATVSCDFSNASIEAARGFKGVTGRECVRYHAKTKLKLLTTETFMAYCFAVCSLRNAVKLTFVSELARIRTRARNRKLRRSEKRLQFCIGHIFKFRLIFLLSA